MKLFVGRLPFELTEEELRELFESCGTVEKATIIYDRETGRSRGFGFVEMSTKEEAEEAISKLHESEVKGRTILVSEARENTNRSSSRRY